jgi:hypothetical protein
MIKELCHNTEVPPMDNMILARYIDLKSLDSRTFSVMPEKYSIVRCNAIVMVENAGQSVTSTLFYITAHPNSVLIHESTFVLTEKILEATFTEFIDDRAGNSQLS